MLIVLAVSVMALVGCAHKPTRLFPAVPADEQLDLSGYVAKPCALLKPDRVAARHLSSPGVVVQHGTGSACRWNTTAAGHPSITVQASVDHGLELIYQLRRSFTYFAPTQISHYPAVYTTSGGRTPSSGICAAHVDVADGAVLTVIADYGGARSSFSADPCPDAANVAFEIISQIRSGNP